MARAEATDTTKNKCNGFARDARIVSKTRVEVRVLAFALLSSLI
jgi:hypothetical protein